MVPVYGLPDIPNERWHDTMSACAVKALPLSLEDAAIALRLPIRKDTEGLKHTLSLSKFNKRGYYDRSPEAIQRTVEYCESDCLAEMKLHTRIGWMPADEREAYLRHQLMNQRGLRIDLAYVAKAQEIVEKAGTPLMARFREITGLNPTQIAKVRDWCKASGTDLPDLSAETVAAALGSSIDDEEDHGLNHTVGASLKPQVREALSIRQLIGSSSIKKLGRMEACVCSDGRARGLSQYHGALPGRSTGRLFQPYNFPRGTLKLDGEAPPPQLVVDAIMTGDPEYVQMVLGPPIETVVSGLRHAIVPDHGNTFLSGDYSGIQARIVLALAGQHDKAALLAAGKDVYCDMAEAVYKRPIDKKRDSAERQVEKNAILGLGFQCGATNFQLKFCRDLPLEFCKEVVRIYRNEWAPKVRKLWYALEKASLAAVRTGKPHESHGIEYRMEDGWLSARAPSGGKIWYWNPQLVKRHMKWDNNDVRPAWTYQTKKNGQWKTIDAYGGQLSENIVMKIEVDIQRHGWKVAEANGYPIVHECYDELVAEVPDFLADQKGFEQCLLEQPPWVRELRVPIAVEGWTGDRYRK